MKIQIEKSIKPILCQMCRYAVSKGADNKSMKKLEKKINWKQDLSVMDLKLMRFLVVGALESLQNDPKNIKLLNDLLFFNDRLEKKIKYGER